MSQILLIEDDIMLGEGLRDFLVRQGFGCQWLTQASQVAAHWFTADLVILDRQLPEGDSLHWLPQWLSQKAIPVIMLTAKTEVDDRVEGLMAGAKDYVVKPFAQTELLARIQAQLRPLGSVKLTYHQISLDLSSHTVTDAGQTVSLKPKEFQLLAQLMQNPERVYHREELLNKVWGFQAFPSTRTVDNHILQLRQKLPALAIETIRGVGYRLRQEHSDATV